MILMHASRFGGATIAADVVAQIAWLPHVERTGFWVNWFAYLPPLDWLRQ